MLRLRLSRLRKGRHNGVVGPGGGTGMAVRRDVASATRDRWRDRWDARRSDAKSDFGSAADQARPATRRKPLSAPRRGAFPFEAPDRPGLVCVVVAGRDAG